MLGVVIGILVIGGGVLLGDSLRCCLIEEVTHGKLKVSFLHREVGTC